MPILNFSKRKNSTKPIETFYAWGDQEPTYEWGCIIAQEMHIERSLRVFKTCASTGNFLKGYNDEECIFLTGLIDQDMLQYEFMRFLCGGKLQRFENIELSNVRVIIITARQMPLDWDFHDAYEQMDMLYSFEVFDHMYEVRTKGSDKVSIYEYETEYGKRPEHITLHESVDLNALSLMKNTSKVNLQDLQSLFNQPRRLMVIFRSEMTHGCLSPAALMKLILALEPWRGRLKVLSQLCFMKWCTTIIIVRVCKIVPVVGPTTIGDFVMPVWFEICL